MTSALDLGNDLVRFAVSLGLIVGAAFVSGALTFVEMRDRAKRREEQIRREAFADGFSRGLDFAEEQRAAYLDGIAARVLQDLEDEERDGAIERRH